MDAERFLLEIRMQSAELGAEVVLEWSTLLLGEATDLLEKVKARSASGRVGSFTPFRMTGKAA